MDEKVIWRAEPAEITLTPTQRVAFWSLMAIGFASFSAAIAVVSTLHIAVGSMILVAGWTVAFALVFRAVIQWWHEGAEYLVTDQRVVWKRGRFARSIQRNGISFARITWLDPSRGIGDIELVRDVAEGVLRRKMTLVLRGLKRPDVLWDVVRAQTPTSRSADETWRGQPLGQRLRHDERVEWSERPTFSLRQLIPSSTRGLLGLALGVAVSVFTVRTIVAAYDGSQHVLAAGIPIASVGFVALVTSSALTALLLFSLGVGILWTSVIRPALVLRDTRYLITNRRVLI
ncbi:MAG: hypothetical protein U0165_19690, partial [Polyangiaceae bacterium]